MTQILFPLLSILPLGLLALALRHWCGWAFEAASRVEPPIRARHRPGAATQKRLEQLGRRLQDTTGLAIALLPILGASYFLAIRDFINPPVSVWGPQLAIAIIAYTFIFVRLARLLDERYELKLKMNGEKIIGKELDHLVAGTDCRVLHDFPLTSHWNIDHVVIAPSGVYAVQTKYRRTGGWRRRQRPHEVIYDGEGLQFPGDYDGESLEIARRRADRLSQLLSRELETEITVKPILALPGWLVRRETGDRIDVLNEYELHRLSCAEPSPKFSASEITRIAIQLESEREHPGF